MDSHHIWIGVVVSETNVTLAFKGAQVINSFSRQETGDRDITDNTDDADDTDDTYDKNDTDDKEQARIGQNKLK